MDKLSLSCTFIASVLVTACFLSSGSAQGTCPPGQEQVECNEDLCSTESCPSFPNATCTIDNCGECNAVFTNANGEVIPKFSCSNTDNYPTCLQTIRCGFIKEACENECPLVPDAVCSLYCDCNVVFTDRRTGNRLSMFNCLPSPPRCPSNQPIAKCAKPFPCERETCSRFPNANCRDSGCRGCNAVFLQKNGDVVPKFACSPKSNWPECLASISCPGIGTRCKDGCPGIPDVRCVHGCDCNIMFLDGVNGNQLSPQQCLPNCSFPIKTCAINVCDLITCEGVPDATCRAGLCGECGATFFDRNGATLTPEQCKAPVTCPSDKPRANCSNVPCDIAQCPEVPGARCYNDYCGGCFAKFITRSGLILAKEACGPNTECPPNKPTSQCKPTLLCGQEKCPRYPSATCSNSFCGGCNVIFTQNDGTVIPKFSCPAESRWPDCLSVTICPDATLSCKLDCPGVPDARCIQDCDCSAIFVDKDNGNTLTRKECLPQCSEEIPKCLVPPCQFDSCPGVPGAICRGEICGGCSSVFYFINGTRVTDEQCKASATCPPEKPRFNCSEEPCKVSKCPGLPLARCENDYCGGCSAVFFTPDGLKPSPEDCNPGLFCPPLFDPDNEEDLGFHTECSNGSRVGSVCTISCPQGQILSGGPSQLTCGSDNKWNGSFENVKCTNKTAPPCPLMIFYRRQVSYGLSCSDGRRVGSVCNVTCSRSRFQVGTRQIKCLSNSTWDGSLSDAQCIRKIVCRPWSPRVKCNQSACANAKCPAEPRAHCVEDSCGKCGFRFYKYGKHLSRKKCLPKRKCFSFSLFGPWVSCPNRCRYYYCRDQPDAMCDMNCSCKLVFYDPITLEKVACKKIRPRFFLF